MNLQEIIQQITGIKPREAFDESFYLDFGEDYPSEELLEQLTMIVKKVAKKYGMRSDCELHEQPRNYTLFCSIED